ncbi:MAG: hypothetical protein GWN55_04835 [Phycisphaerae bacterium]|nr:hypothetical protein [Phycisphaerae bacterium]NIP55329.1 hypothetical protein [Phycisphaerae bacterium]NIS53842.1 hypothetical protein [Phycisphaerae bacterium]NIV00641.1 hypothetical protein [Phycisphaerae bacterium]NIV68929.1 hypothetical protein [Phycisphaerae bacterium]
MTIKISTYVSLILMISLFVTGIGCRNYAGVEWVVDYSKVGKPNVPCRKDCAEGFYNTIIQHPDWVGHFNVGNANAWEKHFKRKSKGGIDDNWIDAVDIAYFAGHGAGAGTKPTGVGTGGGFTFGVDKNDDWVLSAAPFNREPRWGDKDLEWIVLDICSPLALKSDGAGYALSKRWMNSDVMRGLHYILGFRTVAHDNCHRGRIFAEYLTGKRDGKNYTIREAWRKATEDTEWSEVQGAYLRAYSPGCNTYNDHLHEYGPVSADPEPACQCYCYSSWSCL